MRYEIRNPRNDVFKTDFLRESIKVICDNNLHALIVDLDSESDFVFVNAPSMGVRKYASAWEIYHPRVPQDFEVIGDADAAYSQILAMFDCRDADATAPVPTVLDDWGSYPAWMKFILRDSQ